MELATSLPMIDESGFRTFYDLTAKQFLGYLRRVTRNPSLADDIFQEAYARFLQSAIRDSSTTVMKAYLYRIANNLLRDHWRRDKWMRRLENEREIDLPINLDEDRLSVQVAFEQAFDELTQQQRSVLWLAYAEGYRHQEIAEIMGVRVTSVRVMLFRAKKKLSLVLRSLGLREERDGNPIL
jgi:RNA polymerase sigma-70 factor (ECF subfamily)